MGVKPIKGLLLIAMLSSSVAEGQQNLLPHEWILPSSARAEGIGGTFFTTNLTVSNTGTEDAALALKFLGNGIDGRQGTQVLDFLAAGKSKTYVDVLNLAFGLSSGFGAIRIASSSSSMNIVGQTSTPASGGGTYGQSVPAFGSAEKITSGTVRTITAIAETDSFRTNLILANATESESVVDVSLVSDAGATLGSKSYSLPPLGMIQITRIVRDMGVTSNISLATLRLSTATSNGAFCGYAVVIDNVTGDPRTLLPR